MQRFVGLTIALLALFVCGLSQSAYAVDCHSVTIRNDGPCTERVFVSSQSTDYGPYDIAPGGSQTVTFASTTETLQQFTINGGAIDADAACSSTRCPAIASGTCLLTVVRYLCPVTANCCNWHITTTP